jgi:23S rRNA (cytosine1962-C5)-methyltransferase
MPELYQLLDCGNQKKVELFGKYKLVRPCPQALWRPFDDGAWGSVDAEFERTGSEKGTWKFLSNRELPKNWVIESENGLSWQIEPNEFGNLGIFTEHWLYAEDLVEFFGTNATVLDLFSYTGSNSLAMIRAGLKVSVVDSSKNAMNTFTTNLDLNRLPRKGLKLVLEDAYKFCAREVRREKTYDGLVIDAPSYGRGTKGEVFNIEDDITKLLKIAQKLMHEKSKLVLTLHSPRFTPVILEVLISQIFAGKKVEVKEIVNKCRSGARLPSGFLVKVA